MDADLNSQKVLIVLFVVFVGMAVYFGWNSNKEGEPKPSIPPVDSQFIKTSTVRVSLAELTRMGGDISSYDCNSCHEINKPGKIEFGDNGIVVLPGLHQDLVMKHGRNHRNENCYNCHDAANHALLHRSDGRKVPLIDSTQLCAGCHGTTYRDWEIGVHGRISGYWNKKLGSAIRQDCVSCHDPHSPAFPPIKPAPGPHALHPKGDFTKKESH